MDQSGGLSRIPFKELISGKGDPPRVRGGRSCREGQKIMVQELIGLMVWFAANGLYIDLRRKGRQGLARIIFFWMGIPATWLWLFLVPEGKKKDLLPPPEDIEALLEEIRRDRALRAGPGEDPGPGDLPETFRDPSVS